MGKILTRDYQKELRKRTFLPDLTIEGIAGLVSDLPSLYIFKVGFTHRMPKQEYLENDLRYVFGRNVVKFNEFQGKINGRDVDIVNGQIDLRELVLAKDESLGNIVDIAMRNVGRGQYDDVLRFNILREQKYQKLFDDIKKRDWKNIMARHNPPGVEKPEYESTITEDVIVVKIHDVRTGGPVKL